MLSMKYPTRNAKKEDAYPSLVVWKGCFGDGVLGVDRHVVAAEEDIDLAEEHRTVRVEERRIAFV